VRAVTLGLLVAADAVFLWMFLSTDPLEQLAAGLAESHAHPTASAFAYAAAWRHGMAGNSWIYMPGFFATALAVWLHGRHARARVANLERILAALAATGISVLLSPIGADLVAGEFAATSGIEVGGPIPAPSWAGVGRGLYTLATWSVFALACRAGLVRHRLRAFVPAALMTAGLVLVRPWTVDDFVAHWATGVPGGSFSALASLSLVGLVAGLLAAVERSTQPQPREPALADRESACRDHEQHVGGNGDQIEAR
jgi:hypothetical protein